MLLCQLVADHVDPCICLVCCINLLLPKGVCCDNLVCKWSSFNLECMFANTNNFPAQDLEQIIDMNLRQPIGVQIVRKLVNWRGIRQTRWSQNPIWQQSYQ